MRIAFSKYQGTGNDFIMIDGTKKTVNFSVDQIQKLCERRFGIGADGLIIIKNHDEYDFKMDYYNSDGSQSFCGNGSRCAQAYAKELSLIEQTSTFSAIDGVHKGKQDGDDFATRMGNVNEINKIGDDFFINTGSPHYIRYVEDVDAIDVFEEGRKIRYSKEYKQEGTNVNFVTEQDGFLRVRTYERGVEAETFSCGTGVTAVAISYVFKKNLSASKVRILTRGGDLKISLNRRDDQEFSDIWLIGPALKVFEGSFEIK